MRLRGLENWCTFEFVDCGDEPVLAVSFGFVMAGTYEHSARYWYSWILHAGCGNGNTSAAGAHADSPKYEEAPGLVETEGKWWFGFADWRTTTGGERQVRCPLAELFTTNLCSVSLIICRFGSHSNDCGKREQMDGAAAKYQDVSEEKVVSALKGGFEDTPTVVGTRQHLDSIRKLMRGDFYIRLGSRQRKLGRSKFCNNVKVSEVGRDRAIGSFRNTLREDNHLLGILRTLSGRRLVCHCQLSQHCYGDVLIQELRRAFQDAYDRNDSDGQTPSSSILDFVTRLREEPETESDSSGGAAD